MDGDEAQDDPFGVQLEWPDELLSEPYEPATRDASAADAVTPPRRDPGPPTAFVAPAGAMTTPAAPTEVASGASVAPPTSPEPLRLENDLIVMLAKVVARVDALSSTTATFRNLVSDRVSEFTERVVQVASDTAADVEMQRRLAVKDMGDLRSGMAWTNAAVDALTASVAALAGDVERVSQELGSQLERVAEEVQTLRRRTAVRSRATAGTEPDEKPAPPPRRPKPRR